MLEFEEDSYAAEDKDEYPKDPLQPTLPRVQPKISSLTLKGSIIILCNPPPPYEIRSGKEIKIYKKKEGKGGGGERKGMKWGKN